MATAKKEETKVTNVNVMEVFFNGWMKQTEMIEEIEQRALQTIKDQNEWIKGNRDQFLKIEENSKKLTSEWTTNVRKLIDENNVGFNVSNFSNFPDLVSQLEEIGHRTQTLAFLPGKTSFDLISTTGAQLEKSYSRAIDQQKKQREEFTKAWEDAFEQMKQAQNGMFKFFEFIPTNLVK